MRRPAAATATRVVIACAVAVAAWAGVTAFTADAASRAAARGWEERLRGAARGADDGGSGAARESYDPAPGVVMLGMHRSGTSTLAGLLTAVLGLHVGAPADLMGAAFDNRGGFYERWDVMDANNELLAAQGASWDHGVAGYNASAGYLAVRDHTPTLASGFAKGRAALAFLNDPQHVPWLSKDPRACITLGSWLPLYNGTPAVVFTFRDPLAVARSLARRNGLPLARGVALWVEHNTRALQQVAAGRLCRAVTAHHAVLADPMREVRRVTDALRRCGVRGLPAAVDWDGAAVREAVAAQVGRGRHGADASDDVACPWSPAPQPKLHPHLGRLRNTDASVPLAVLEPAMELYCALRSGAAHEPGYVFPEL